MFIPDLAAVCSSVRFWARFAFGERFFQLNGLPQTIENINEPPPQHGMMFVRFCLWLIRVRECVFFRTNVGGFQVWQYGSRFLQVSKVVGFSNLFFESAVNR